MIDRERIQEHLSSMARMVGALRNHSTRRLDELTEDIDLLSAVEHEFQVAIQNVLDIGAHILVADSLNQFREYRDIPKKLAGHGVITKELGEKLANLAGLRNILVHSYLVIRTDIIHQHLQTDLHLFDEFARCIENYLAARSA